MSKLVTAGKVLTVERRKFTARRRDLSARFAGEIRQVVSSSIEGVPDKEIADATGATPRTAKAWRHGEHAPNAHHLLLLALDFPEIKAAIRRWIDLDPTDGDDAEEAQRLMADLQRLIARRPS